MDRNLIILPDGTEIFSGAGLTNAIKSCQHTEIVNSETELTIGSVCAACLEVSIIAPGGALSIDQGTEVAYYRVDDTGERTKVGLFTCEKPTRSGNVYKFTAYDRVTRLDVDLTDWLSELSGWPYTLLDFAGMVCEQCGLMLTNTSLINGDYEIQQFSASVTGRQLMQWIGQICARFCRSTVDGDIEYAWYTATGQTILPSGSNAYFAGSFSYEDFQTAAIDKVQVKNGDSDVGAIYPADATGTNAYVIDSNPLLTSSSNDAVSPVAQAIYEALEGVTYTPCKVSIRANSAFHAGDIVRITDSNGNTITTYVMSREQSGQKVTLESTGSASRDSVTATNSTTLSSLNGKVLNIESTIDGLKIKNADQDGKYAALSLTVDGIKLSVSDINENYASLELQVDGISGTVSSVQETLSDVQEAVLGTITKVEVQYALGTSTETAPTSGWSTTAPEWEAGKYMWQKTVTTYSSGTVQESDPTCIAGATGATGEKGDTGSTGAAGADGVGIASIVPQYYLSSSDTECVDGTWSDTMPTWADGYYIWTRSYITWDNGTTSTTSPVLAGAINSANESAAQAVTISTETAAKVEILDKSITAEVTRATTAEGALSAADTKYGTCSTAAATAAKTVTCSAFSSDSLVAGATICVYFTYANTAASPTLNVNGTGAKSIYAYGAAIASGSEYNWAAKSYVTFVYNGAQWCMVDGSANSKIAMLADSISLSVTGSLGNTASIVLSVDGTETEYGIDLSGVRSAFAADTSAITISAGTVTFDSNTFAVKSDNFSLTAAGAMTATAGTIAGWTIGDKYLMKNSSVTAGTASTQYGVLMYAPATVNTGWAAIGVRHRDYDGSSYGDWTYDCYMRYDGYFYANNANIKGRVNATSGSFTGTVYASDGEFNGTVYASDGEFTGKITTSSGTIGGFTIGSNYIAYDATALDNSIMGSVYIGTNGINIGGGGLKVTVTSNDQGVFYSNARTFNVDNTSGYFAGYMGIGGTTTSSSYKLYISGATYSTSYISSLYHIVRPSASTSVAIRPSTSGYGYVGTSSYKFNAVYASTGTIQTSDRKLKTNIQELPQKYLELFLRLIPVSYQMKDGASGRTHIGFIAQDVEDAMTDLGIDSLEFAGFCKAQDYEITGVDDDGNEISEYTFDEDGNPVYNYFLRYEEFIAINTAAIQTLWQKVAALESAIN